MANIIGAVGAGVGRTVAQGAKGIAMLPVNKLREAGSALKAAPRMFLAHATGGDPLASIAALSLYDNIARSYGSKSSKNQKTAQIKNLKNVTFDQLSHAIIEQQENIVNEIKNLGHKLDANARATVAAITAPAKEPRVQGVKKSLNETAAVQNIANKLDMLVRLNFNDPKNLGRRMQDNRFAQTIQNRGIIRDISGSIPANDAAYGRETPRLRDMYSVRAISYLARMLGRGARGAYNGIGGIFGQNKKANIVDAGVKSEAELANEKASQAAQLEAGHESHEQKRNDRIIDALKALGDRLSGAKTKSTSIIAGLLNMFKKGIGGLGSLMGKGLGGLGGLLGGAGMLAEGFGMVELLPVIATLVGAAVVGYKIYEWWSNLPEGTKDILNKIKNVVMATNPVTAPAMAASAAADKITGYLNSKLPQNQEIPTAQPGMIPTQMRKRSLLQRIGDKLTGNRPIGDEFIVNQTESMGGQYDMTPSKQLSNGGHASAYGKYQMVGDTIKDFFANEGSDYKDYFAGLKPHTGAFDAQWARISNSNDDFNKAQDAYSDRKYLQPAIKAYRDMFGSLPGDLTRQTLYSASVHGGANSIDEVLKNAVAIAGSETNFLLKPDKIKAQLIARGEHMYGHHDQHELDTRLTNTLSAIDRSDSLSSMLADGLSIDKPDVAPDQTTPSVQSRAANAMQKNFNMGGGQKAPTVVVAGGGAGGNSMASSSTNATTNVFNMPQSDNSFDRVGANYLSMNQ